jgi:hypothetical protein
VRRLALLLIALSFTFSCASSTAPSPGASSASKPVAEQEEPRRALGTMNDVRIDVAVYSDKLTPNTVVPIKWDITNHRDRTILVADLIPNAMYDPDTRTVTVDLGSEIPGENFLPRLIAVRPQERKSFSGSAHVNIAANPVSPWTPKPNGIRVRLNFLDDTSTFAPLIEIKEKAVYDPKLADALFQKWVDNNETVVTNTLPMRWSGGMAAEEGLTPATDPRRAGRGRGRP